MKSYKQNAEGTSTAIDVKRVEFRKKEHRNIDIIKAERKGKEQRTSTHYVQNTGKRNT